MHHILNHNINKVSLIPRPHPLMRRNTLVNQVKDDKQSVRTPCHHLETVPEDDVSHNVVRYKLCLEVAVTVWTATPWYVPV